MTRISLAVLLAAIAMLLGLGAHLVSAQAEDEPIILTEAQTEAVIESCSVSKIALNDVHYSDAAMRVNLGQEYANITGRLMAPMNSRISLSGRDGVELTRITADYNTERNEFIEAYRRYDNSVSSALGIDCRQNPAEYYAAIIDAREQRALVRQSARELNSLARQYQVEFEKFTERMEQD